MEKELAEGRRTVWRSSATPRVPPRSRREKPDSRPVVRIPQGTPHRSQDPPTLTRQPTRSSA